MPVMFETRGAQIPGATVAPNVCGSLVWNLFYVTSIAPRVAGSIPDGVAAIFQ